MMNLVSASCNHELLAPIRCIIQMVATLRNEVRKPDKIHKLEVIHNTASFLLNQVQANIDQGLLNLNKLVPNLAAHKIIEDVVSPVLDIFRLQAKVQKVELYFDTSFAEFRVMVDKTRT